MLSHSRRTVPTPDSVSQELHQVLSNGQKSLLKQQHKDGYWWYTLEANDSINAEYIMLLRILGLSEPRVEAALCRWMINNQREDGSWSLYYGAPGDISTTVECYLALKLCGYTANNPVLKHARNFILARGGITKIRIFSRVHLALLGLVHWDICPAMPTWLMLLPPQSPINIYEFSSWARACIVPLLIIMDRRKTVAVNIDLDELYINGPDKDEWSYGEKAFLSLENAFLQIDKALHWTDKLGFKPFAERSLKACESYIREHIKETADIFPAMFYGVLALTSLGYGLNDSDVQIAMDGLKSFQIWMPPAKEVLPVPFQGNLPTTSHGKSLIAEEPVVNGEMLYQQCCISPVWDTAWAGVALVESDVARDHPELLKAARWLIQNQIADIKGDWKIKNPDGVAGGWAFEFLNKYYPDIDDTMVVLSFLYNVDLPSEELQPTLDRGLAWLLSMQSKNGGFAAFDKDNDKQFLNKIPFADHGACLDPPTADITGRMIEFLLHSCRFNRNDTVIQRAADFIVKQQSADGSFWGRWGVSYVHGTWSALAGLCALKRPQDKVVIERAIRWLKSVQNADGGYGESCASDAAHKYIATETSGASQTAWALMALVNAGEPHSAEAQRAADWLATHQNGDGTWDEALYTGTGFPGHFYIRYHGYRHFFPVMALGRYRRATTSK